MILQLSCNSIKIRSRYKYVPLQYNFTQNDTTKIKAAFMFAIVLAPQARSAWNCLPLIISTINPMLKLKAIR